MAEADGRPVRRAGRVIVVDTSDRVLLLRYDSIHYGLHWGTPGGGVEPGEDYHAAACRELAEETGWHDVAVGTDVVHERIRPTGPSSQFSAAVHRYFTGRVRTAGRPLGDGLAQMHAADGIIGYRWWTIAEIEATTEVIWPRDLADVLRRLSAAGQLGPMSELASESASTVRPRMRATSASEESS